MDGGLFARWRNGGVIAKIRAVYASSRGKSVPEILSHPTLGVTVETIYLGKNHLRREGLPLLYETRINGAREPWRRHSTTKVEAIALHHTACKLAREQHAS